MFAIAPLDWIEWKAVLLLSAPVVLIDEVLKFLTVRPRPNLIAGRSRLIFFARATSQMTLVSPPSKIKMD
jgi:hypothetical protein